MLRNENFDQFIQLAKATAAEMGLVWDVPVEIDGSVPKRHAWDLDRMVGAPSAFNRISSLGADRRTLVVLNMCRRANDLPEIPEQVLSKDWRDLIQAVAIDKVLLRKNQPGSTLRNTLRPLRVLATCAIGTEPWAITVDQVRLAMDMAGKVQASGKLRSMVEGVVGGILDMNHVTDRFPLLPAALQGKDRTNGLGRYVRPNAGTGDIRSQLHERKSAEKLPEMQAFWELVRIVFTEEPRTFMDALRFDQCKALICTGFRINEACIIPVDWRRTRNYVTADGRPAGEAGGISTSLMIRHFAEKQRGAGDDSVVLYETTQHVPQMFEAIIDEALGNILARTAPMRTRLARQIETGRLFPEFASHDLVPAIEFFPRLSGDLRVIADDLPADLVAEYRRTWNPAILDQLWETQRHPIDRVRKGVVAYFAKLGSSAAGYGALRLPVRAADGSRWQASVIRWPEAYVRVGEVEEFVHTAMPTKVPDHEPYRLSGNRSFYPHELLLLAPKRSLSEERNGNLCDIGRYVAVGKVDGLDLRRHLGGRDNNLFSRYGETAEDRKLTLTKTHSIRHLQNTEMFRLGLADTLISKRFDRRSVPQSYVYDHRSLVEDLDAIDLPPQAIDRLPPKAQQVLKLIKIGKVYGPLVEEFRRIQGDEGEDAALDYLAVEADGFHATPYGYCINSFTVDPCPKHLECFNGCRHLSKSQNPDHTANLDRIEQQLELAVVKIQAMPPGSIGRENQLREAQTKIENVRKTKSVAPGDRPFPDGKDLSETVDDLKGRTLFDAD